MTTLSRLLLLGAVLLSAFLHFVNIDSIGDANLCYTAAVESMLQSDHNYFFIAAEPGGSVTIDKPPLGLWVQAAFAAVLGVSGIAVSLPNILAGILSVPLLYLLVRRSFGPPAGLLAAYAMAVTPVVFAADRNNTTDGLLTFVLLLTAWAFLNAIRSGRLVPLLLGAALIGLGFNIKMMQAFLPLPAFLAAYFFLAPAGWSRKTARLGLAALVITVLSLAWPLAVDSVPADQRPFVGGSSSNSVMELIVDYNGLDRLLGEMRGPGLLGRPPAGGPRTGDGAPPAGLPGGQPPPPDGGGPVVSPEIGAPGPLRFFQAPLAKELSWLLPFGLLGLLLAAHAAWLGRQKGSEYRPGVLVWGGWLLTCLVFFSLAGFFHAYYLVMLVPALAGCLGMGLAAILSMRSTHPRRAAALLLIGAGLTFAFQYFLVGIFSTWAWWGWLGGGVLLAGGLLLAGSLTPARLPAGTFPAGAGLLLAGILIVPLAWSALTVTDDTPNNMLPAAYGGTFGFGSGQFVGGISGGTPAANSPLGRLLAFTQENTRNIRYLLAVPSSMIGAALVLETGRPVLYMGGFNGTDQVIDAQGLSDLAARRELRYVLSNPADPGPFQYHRDIGAWLENTCSVVEGYQLSPGPFMAGSLRLYDCLPAAPTAGS